MNCGAQRKLLHVGTPFLGWVNRAGSESTIRRYTIARRKTTRLHLNEADPRYRHDRGRAHTHRLALEQQIQDGTELRPGTREFGEAGCVGAGRRRHRPRFSGTFASGESIPARIPAKTPLSHSGSHEKEFGAVMLGRRHGFELQFIAISYSLVPESLPWLPARFS